MTVLLPTTAIPRVGAQAVAAHPKQNIVFVRYVICFRLARLLPRVEPYVSKDAVPAGRMVDRASCLYSGSYLVEESEDFSFSCIWQHRVGHDANVGGG